MHGSVFIGLRDFVTERFGAPAWTSLVRMAGASDAHDPATDYPDAELQALVGAAVAATKIDAAVLIEQFGDFLAPKLMDLYWVLLKPEWRTLEFLENVQDHIHRVVSLDAPAAKPPYLGAARVAPDEVVITYRSPRRLCALARGMARGVARRYDEHVEVVERTCMLAGAPECTLSVRKLRG